MSTHHLRSVGGSTVLIAVSLVVCPRPLPCCVPARRRPPVYILPLLPQAVPEIVQQTMDEVAAVTGRPHKLFEYVGHPEAERVIIAMGSGCPVIEEAVDYLTARGEKVSWLVATAVCCGRHNSKSWLFAVPANCCCA